MKKIGFGLAATLICCARSYLFTVLAFVALLMGVTTACNRDPIDIQALEKELVGMWWDEYAYHDVTEDGVPFDRVLLFVGANEDHTGYLYLAAFDNHSDEAVAAYESGFKWALTQEGNIVLSDPVTDESIALTKSEGGSYGNEMTDISGTSLTYADGSVILANASYSGTLYKASAQQQTDVQSQATLLPKNASSSDIGKQICVDGHVHTAGVRDYCSADRVAMITYVGNDAETNTKYNHGLALALSDADDGDRIEWCDREEYCGRERYSSPDEAKTDMAGLANTDYLLNKNKWHNHSAASAARNYKYKKKAKNGAHPKGTSEWFLPSVGQWDKMVIAAGGCKNLQNNASLDTYDGYHSSTEIHSYQVWCFRLYNNVYFLRVVKSSTGVRVRPALAF